MDKEQLADALEGIAERLRKDSVELRGSNIDVEQDFESKGDLEGWIHNAPDGHVYFDIKFSIYDKEGDKSENLEEIKS